MTKGSETSRITLRVPAGMKEWLAKRADLRGISQNALIILSLEALRDAEAPAQK
jgi:predicted HicB family RNase H-like nuclease